MFCSFWTPCTGRSMLKDFYAIQELKPRRPLMRQPPLTGMQKQKHDPLNHSNPLKSAKLVLGGSFPHFRPALPTELERSYSTAGAISVWLSTCLSSTDVVVVSSLTNRATLGFSQSRASAAAVMLQIT